MAEFIRIEGLENVRQALLNTPVDLRKKVIHSVLRKAAQPILRAAKAAAPVAKKATNRVIPGLLKRTLSITRSKLQNASRGDFGVFITARVPGKVKRIGRMAARAGMKGPNFGDPFYHRFQEAGFHATGARKIKGGKRNRAANLKASGARFIAGKAYLGNAYETNRMAAVNLIQSELVTETVAAFNRRAKR